MSNEFKNSNRLEQSFHSWTSHHSEERNNLCVKCTFWKSSLLYSWFIPIISGSLKTTVSLIKTKLSEQPQLLGRKGFLFPVARFSWPAAFNACLVLYWFISGNCDNFYLCFQMKYVFLHKKKTMRTWNNWCMGTSFFTQVFLSIC